VDAADDGFVVDHKARLSVLQCGLDNAGIAFRPIVSALGDQPHAISVALKHQPEAIILDLVRSKADINQPAVPAQLVENDPLRTCHTKNASGNFSRKLQEIRL